MMTVGGRASVVEGREMSNLGGSHCTDFQIVFVCVLFNVVVGEGKKVVCGEAKQKRRDPAILILQYSTDYTQGRHTLRLVQHSTDGEARWGHQASMKPFGVWFEWNREFQVDGQLLWYLSRMV